MRKLALFLIGCVLLSSCEDTFTTTLEIDPPKFEEAMVINGFFNNINEFDVVQVTETYPVLDPKNFEEVILDDAEVKLYQNENLISTFDFDLSSNYLSNENVIWEAGLEYRLEVNHPKYGSHTATQVYPSGVEIDTVIFVENGGVDIDGFEVSRLEISITDPVDEDNYYALSLAGYNPRNGDFYFIDFNTLDPLVEDDAYYIDVLLPDDAFNGKKYVLNLLTDRSNAQRILTEGVVVLKSVTEDYYKYNTTLRAARDEDDFAGFTEPALVHTNFDEALGAFLLINTQVYPLPR